VLHMIDTLGAGGTEQGLVALLPALARHGVYSEVLSLAGPQTVQHDLEASGVPVYTLGLQTRRDIWRAATQVRRFLRHGQYDLVHSRLFFSCMQNALARLTAPGPRRVASFHNETFVGFPPNTAWKRVRLWLEAGAMRSCMDGTAAISRAVKDHHQRYLGLRDITVIYNAFDVEGLASVAPAPQRLRSDRLNVVIAGRLVEQKGHDVLLQAWQGVELAGLDAHLHVFGDGPLRATIEEQVRALSLERVCLHGYVSQQALLGALAAADLVVMPSRWEGFGRSAGEAMALGRPVIASDVGGLREFIVHGESGLLVPPGDSHALSTVVDRLLRAPEERAQLGRNAKTRIHEGFGVDRCAREYKAFYEQVLAGT